MLQTISFFETKSEKRIAILRSRKVSPEDNGHVHEILNTFKIEARRECHNMVTRTHTSRGVKTGSLFHLTLQHEKRRAERAERPT